MDGCTWGGSHRDRYSGLGTARLLGKVDATPRPSFEAGIAVGRSGTHLAFLPLE